METFKLKTISVKDLQASGGFVREGPADMPMTLKVGEIICGKVKHHHFQVSRQSSVEIIYEIREKQQFVRILLDLLKNNLSIHSFMWTHETNRYEQTAIEEQLMTSKAFQTILQSITFSGSDQQSYLFQLHKK
ncbi:hypothetical protein [Metabacillus indicus]|uniref:hypothetical protein n=1 Tax=Metabacillus indicus TaxID=246786 RepID=UPI0004938DFF|nr:hypothetical protein [Metabacillus indicus]KEZ48840.1 hypothetical protein AZ46_0218405 [Metabacillus indicus LMG 22858]